MTPKQKQETEFCVFVSPQFGIRAVAKLLQTYDRKYGLNCIREVIFRWAPPNENDTLAYVRFVEGKTGFKADEEWPLNSFVHYLTVIKAIIHMENGEQPYSDQTITEGLALAGVEPVVPVINHQVIKQVIKSPPSGSWLTKLFKWLGF